MENTTQDNRKLTKVKVWFTLQEGMVEVSNQGLDDRYIRLQLHWISLPVVSGLRQSDLITFFRPGFWPSFHVWFRSTKKLWQKTKTQIITKFPFNGVSNRNWFLSHNHAHLTRLVLQRAICSRINRFCLNLFRCCKSKRCCNLNSWVCWSRTRK